MKKQVAIFVMGFLAATLIYSLTGNYLMYKYPGEIGYKAADRAAMDILAGHLEDTPVNKPPMKPRGK